MILSHNELCSGHLFRYAEQPDYDEPHLTNGRHNWVDLTQPELLCWFGILILMGLKVLPHRRLYWDVHAPLLWLPTD